MNIVLVMDRIENALLNTFLGMGTVFVVLVIIIFFISLLGIIPKLKSNKNKDENNISEIQNKYEEDNNESQKNDILMPNEDNLVKDKELVAVIIAAITAYLGDEAPKDGLVVRSIKRANVDNWKRS
jgi:sodium pump decarboxylase gamma subunit